jgi:glycerol-3-phosphate acyltransferase PlsY
VTTLLSVLAGALLGSVPTAYLLVKRRHGLDVRFEGSTNVGANNAWRTTGSRRLGVAVMLLDALKGAAAVSAGWAVASVLGEAVAFDAAFRPRSAALLGAIAGHNYNLWLSLGAGRLAGGKGLATAAGGFLVLMPLVVPVWGVLFVLGRWAVAPRGVRDTVWGNVVATALVPAAAWAIYGTAGFVVVLGVALLVLPKHVGQVRALLKARSRRDSPHQRETSAEV